jgi:hypothetical protein
MVNLQWFMANYRLKLVKQGKALCLLQNQFELTAFIVNGAGKNYQPSATLSGSSHHN